MIASDPQDNVPRALEPIYTTGEVNAPIELWAGELELSIGEKKVTGNGRVQFLWLPHPHVAFELSADNAPWLLDADEVSLRSPERGIDAKGRVTRSSIGQRAEVSGHLTEPRALGGGGDLACVMFHMTNFERVGRVTLQADNWNVIVDSIEQGQLAPLRRVLDAGQGYAITHVGKLEKCDGSDFTDREATDMLSALHYFLSFVRGMWCTPILAVGFDGAGKRVWEEWTPRWTDHWHHVEGWFDGSPTQDLREAFSGFMRRWRDPLWQEPARLAISWYLESSTPTSVESGIVLTQVGLELLAWVSFVEDGHTVSPRGFDKLPASDRFRLLLSRSGIPLDIPSTFRDLLALAKKRGWHDGPRALTELRNGIVHPKKRRSVSGAGQAATDAWWLGLWCLELVLLHLFGHRGTYSNRLKNRNRGDLEPVPWVAR